MSNPKIILLQNRKITVIFLVGAVLLTIGVALWFYIDGIIQAHQQTLQNPNLTLQQRWATEGSLQWWITAKATLYCPTAATLITVGLIALLYVTLWAIVQPS
ncbi:MAG: hypothetical protein QXU45_03140 [Candidatus Bathyarchaeia archaeon]